jgi:Dolichyl-phosphate-mannose-protein mannosyltransferase
MGGGFRVAAGPVAAKGRLVFAAGWVKKKTAPAGGDPFPSVAARVRQPAMSAAPPPSSAAGPSPRLVGWLVAALLAIYAAVALVAAAHKGLSFDEGEQIAVGYDMWVRRDFRMETANGDLVKRWATLPLLISRPKLPPVTDPKWREGEPYVVGYEFFFRCGNREESLLRQCRAMMALLGMATGLLVFWCSRTVFGAVGGLISLAIFVLSPHMLAFGGTVATAMTLCPTLLAATWCAWRLMHRVSWGRLAASLAAAGLLVLAKLTAVVLLPIVVILVAVKLASGRALEWRLGRTRWIRPRWVQAGIFGGLIVLHAVVGWGFIWAQYDFRYAASPDPSNPAIVMRVRPYSDERDPTVRAALQWARRVHFFPEGFLHGTRWLLGSNDTREAFMHGEWTTGGWVSFFPYTLWVKTTPYLMVLLLLGAAGSWWRWRVVRREARDNAAGKGARGTNVSLYDLAPFVTLIGVYLTFALCQDLNIGHRHILPIYPAIYVLAGAAGSLWTLRARWPRFAVLLALAAHVVDTGATFPDFLAYFSPLAGGPSQGYKMLVDSSLDWGMDLPGLKQWLEENNPGNREPVYLAYFGTDSPDHYGIKCRRLPGFFDWRPRQVYALEPGIYAISATLLQSVYTYTFGPWNSGYERRYQRTLHNLQVFEQAARVPGASQALLKQYPLAFWDHQYDAYEKLRFGRLCSWLRRSEEPDDDVGHSILIWRLDAGELRQALFAPPVEIDDRPN